MAKEEQEFDPGQIKELIDAYQAWVLQERDYLESIYEFNVKLASIERTIGGTSLIRP